MNVSIFRALKEQKKTVVVGRRSGGRRRTGQGGGNNRIVHDSVVFRVHTQTNNEYS